MKMVINWIQMPLCVVPWDDFNVRCREDLNDDQVTANTLAVVHRFGLPLRMLDWCRGNQAFGVERLEHTIHDGDPHVHIEDVEDDEADIGRGARWVTKCRLKTLGFACGLNIVRVF